MSQEARYRIIGTTMPAVVVYPRAGETFFTESGGMAWMSWNIEMKTSTGGGLGKGLARMFTGESLFITDYTCTTGVGQIAFASSFPGRIIPLELGPGQSMICQKKSFLAAEKSVTLSIAFHQKLGAGFFGGEGFIMQRMTGPGLAFAEIDGDVEEVYLEEGNYLKVDPGHVALMDVSVNFSIERVKGFANIFFGGEGLFLATVRGPGKVWLQTMPIQNVARTIYPYLPIPKGD